MGDRCYLSLSLHGRIETVDALNQVIAALEEQGMYNDTFEGEFINEFAGGAENARSPAFHQNECNNADIGGVEMVLQSLSIPYRVEHDAGHEYCASSWSWTPEQGTTIALRVNGIGEVVEVALLKAALDEADPIAVVKALFEKNVFASGRYLPEFTVSQAVHEHLGVGEAITC